MKNNTLMVVIALSTLFVAIVGASFAYFNAIVDNAAESKVNVTTSTVDSLVYTTTDQINLVAHQHNFYEGAGDLIAFTTTKVTLNANNMENASYCYLVSLNVKNNTFVYTTSSLVPEIILTVSKINELGETTTIISNYDITTFKGEIKIPTSFDNANYKNTINASASEIVNQSYKATVIMKNLETNQKDNEGKVLNAQFVLTTVSCD